MLFLLPGLLILPHFFDVPTDGVWYAMPVSDAMATLLSAILLGREIRKLKNQKGQVPDGAVASV